MLGGQCIEQLILSRRAAFKSTLLILTHHMINLIVQELAQSLLVLRIAIAMLIVPTDIQLVEIAI